jgi:hypothetical protein
MSAPAHASVLDLWHTSLVWSLAWQTRDFSPYIRAMRGTCPTFWVN